MNIVGIDPSLTGFAIAIYEGENLDQDMSLYEYSSKSLGKQLRRRHERYEGILSFMRNNLKAELNDKVDLILVEGYSFNSKGSQVTLAEFGGYLRNYLIKNYPEADILEVPPTVLKKFITGKGNANKILVASCLANKYGKVFNSDNEADAYALSIIGRVYAGVLDPCAKYQKDAISQLE